MYQNWIEIVPLDKGIWTCKLKNGAPKEIKEYFEKTKKGKVSLGRPLRQDPQFEKANDLLDGKLSD